MGGCRLEETLSVGHIIPFEKDHLGGPLSLNASAYPSFGGGGRDPQQHEVTEMQTERLSVLLIMQQ